MSLWSDPDLRELFLSNTPLIDVRAEVEFEDGAIPHSVNLPILNSEERHLVGTCYKEQGQDAAIVLGHKLVSGAVKERRVQAWLQFLTENPSAEVFCFRGGLRSQISCQWLSEQGIQRVPLKGGYKRLRKFLLSLIQDAPLPLLTRLGGLTGSGKTQLLQELPSHIDLEAYAHHRGSAFGGMGRQPSQITFENRIALGLLQNPEKLILEDESVMLGKLTIPPRLYQAMKQSRLVVLRTTIEERVQNIFRDYVLEKDAEFFLSAVDKITRHFGGARTSALKTEITDAFAGSKDVHRHSEWIKTLLESYYDPFYVRSLNKQRSQIIFEGSATEIREFSRTL